MQLEAGYRIERVASEPDVQSPVAMDFDERGRLFVVEMPGYPLDTSPSGRVRLLEDRDGDGRFEHSSVFADGLVLPTGVMRWRRGVIVTAAPDVLYLEDADDDGRADRREVLLTGFATTNPQHRVNTPLLGLDNLVYLAHEGPAEAIIYRDLFGDRGTPLTSPAHPGRPPVPPRRSGVRFDPDTGAVDLLAGHSQYGHGFDEYGHYFTADNSNHARHEVIAARYLERNPDLLASTAMADIPDHGGAARVFPITKRPTFELLTEAGQFTSACAITPYTGGAFPGGASLFVAEPVHNLVHRDRLAPNGATFTASRVEPEREFLAAGDAWFRPVFLSVGPDGALYVVDYYRARIEHPEWSASDVQKDPSPLYQGRDRGRIYRVVHESIRGTAPRRPALGTASTADLVAALADRNAWWRRTAQRLLVERRDPAAVPLLRRQAAAGSALARLHALWTLTAFESPGPDLIASALASDDPGLRENAIQLAESSASRGAPARRARLPDLESRLVAMADDPDPRVRFQVLATLGSFSSPAARAARDRLLDGSIDDRWMQLAALSAGSDQALAYFDTFTGNAAGTSEHRDARARFIQQAATVIGARQHADEVRHVIDRVRSARAASDEWWAAAALSGLAKGARGHQKATEVLSASRGVLLALQQDPSAEIRRASLDLLRLAGPGTDGAWRTAIEDAMASAADERTDAPRRADAVALVALDRDPARAGWFEKLISAQEPEPVQAAAVRALGMLTSGARPRIDAAAIGRFLIGRWDALTPAVRGHAADVLLDSESTTRMLIQAITIGAVQPWTLDFWQKRALVMHEKPAIRDEARALLEEDPRHRAQTVRRYAAALDLAGDATRGADVFARVCAACHRLGDTPGADLGPDLATVRHRPALSLLSDILLPSGSIAQNYETYIIERADGETDSGVLGGQTPTTITLRQGQGREIVVRRADIRKMTVAPQSSMPADLDKVIAPDDMADLLAFIRRQ